jgi:hypothetical protein
VAEHTRHTRQRPPIGSRATKFVPGSMESLYTPKLAHRSGQGDNFGAGEATVLDLKETEGPMRLAPFIGG